MGPGSAWLNGLRSLLLTAWVGSLWGVGYVVAPILFQIAPSRVLAGEIAGHCFWWVGVIGLVCGALLLPLALTAPPSRDRARGVALVLVLAVGSLLQLFYFQPHIAAIKAAIGPVDPALSPAATLFARWHGFSSVAYLLQSLAGALLVAWGEAPWRGR